MKFKPTESELEILQVIWEKDHCTVREVHEELAKTKDSVYTTTLKQMQVMFDKGMVERDASSKTHIYKALISRDETQKTFLDKLISTVFTGSASDLVIQALGRHKTSKDEIETIKKYLEQFDQNNKNT
ncbi:BlaI/MecI/CopY family transcriptional regulator [Pedobacter metabolipauper]|nr:BlaI/MecI/CopY family transcriptional regulator [Pedobacter metabolipauper]